MYERNAIVLERYFYEIFDFKNSSNLKENYNNYRKLFECYGNLCDAKQKEKVCQEEFNNISQEIAEIQKKQEELYNKGTKFEYSRYVIFNNIKEIPETIEKHLEKVNENVITNVNELKELSDKFIQAIIDYNKKENNYKESILARENAQKDYDTAYLKAKECYSNITEEKIKEVEEFINSDNKDSKKELQSIFEENGKNEKNQFDLDVLLNTINKSMEIYKNEMDVYLAGFDRIDKLFEEIETDSLKIDKHTKYYRDSKAKVDFLNSEKEYIIQFLDNERIGAIYDKKTHRKLMLEACKKFNLDYTQINNLYDIILKEIAGRSTKKIYKENYNKEYFIELENSSIEPSLDTGKMRQEAIAFVNLNYWRIEGMRSIYNTFENVVTEIYGKDLTEFLPEELKQSEVEEENVIEEQVIDKKEENIEIIENVIDENIISQEMEACVDNDVNLDESNENEIEIDEQDVEMTKIEEQEVENQESPKQVYYSSKISLAKAIYISLQTREFAIVEDEVEEVNVQYSDDDSTKQILSSIDDIYNFEDEENDSNEDEALEIQIDNELEDDAGFEDTFDLSKLDEIEDDENLIIKNLDEIDDLDELENEIEKLQEEKDDESDFELCFEEDSEDDDSILEIYYSEDKENDNSIENVKKKAGFFKKLVGFNAKEKKKA